MSIDVPAFIQGRQFTISCKFDVLADAHPQSVTLSSTKQFHSTITTQNHDGVIIDHVIEGSPAEPDFAPVSVDGVYVLNGRLISPNGQSTPRLFYEPTYHLVSRSLETSASVFANQVSVQSVGYVKSVSSTSIISLQGGLSLIVTHDDYDQLLQCVVSFDVEYVCSSLSPIKIPDASRLVGHEIFIVGFLTGKDEREHMWQVEVDKCNWANMKAYGQSGREHEHYFLIRPIFFTRIILHQLAATVQISLFCI
ncbi:uncharacterized protein MELLADRAFT_109769 [Melampsora larici-populina 98AG31]|uniref:Uncharacterized protein n=1 Tax=Melampsora larici-populina (strain 98AG31 / pathotype 3-4-7) TaxID=747676 RepID=F4RXK3_MELLP|nr:uncharacterized protein MELLADRAFT_109769 [Melampsora larici-populina 98AG31]EGG02738.1 hypothetical protein MELLADRAFT_109769 [Melampsora larici-populina 98AG31]